MTAASLPTCGHAGRTLTADDLATVRHALDDAIEYRRDNGSGHCAWCNAGEASPCEDHAADARLAIAYSDLALQLEGEPA